MSGRRVGLLGGTFDPIHMGHLDVGTVAQAALDLAEVLVIPANVPPHRPKPLTSSFHRFAMVALAVAGRSGWRASDVELRHESPSYTSVTLQRFHDRGYQPGELYFLLGTDAFADITKWRDYPAILDRAHFAVVSRPGLSVSTLPERLPQLADRMVRPGEPRSLAHRTAIILVEGDTTDVSSTSIRHALATEGNVTGMLDPRVQAHIEQHGLYRSPTPERRGTPIMPLRAAGRLHGQD